MKITLATRRRWNWKVFLVLAGLIIPATYAVLPYTTYLQAAYNETNASPGWATSILNQLIGALQLVVMGGIGLALANRIGLGLPFIEGWVKHEPIPFRFRHMTAIALIAGIGIALSIVFLGILVFSPLVRAMYEQLGMALPAENDAPPLYGLLASLYGGIAEETQCRLFGLSLLAWLGGLLFHDGNGRPKLAVFWTANFLFALAFGALHLPFAASLGVPINALIVSQTLILNGIGGLVFGWLFFTFGLESAMLAHFFVDIILHVLLPFIAMWQGETASSLATAGVGLVILLALAWGWQTLRRETRHVAGAEPQVS